MISLSSSFFAWGLDVDQDPDGFSAGFTTFVLSVSIVLGSRGDGLPESGILETGSLDAARLEDFCGGEVTGTFVLKIGFIVVHLNGFVAISVAFFLGFVGFVSGVVCVVVDPVVG